MQIYKYEFIFYGKLEFIRSLISYEGNTAKQLRSTFEDAVDDYLATCKQENIVPETPFKGSLNVRIGKELHRELAVAAVNSDISINSYIKSLLEKGVTVTKRHIRHRPKQNNDRHMHD